MVGRTLAIVQPTIMKSTEGPNPNVEPARESDEVDVSLIEDSLRLTPWQRLVENERALALVRMLESAGSKADGAAQPDS
jgi:hypothetical protein